MQAELILSGGTVRSGHDGWRAHAALALGGGRVLALGSRAEAEALAGPGTRRVDLAGGCALPGLTDAHLHILSYGLTLTRLDLSGVPSLARFCQLVVAAAAQRPVGSWILGRGWDQERLAEGRYPSRQDLDAVAPQHPVFLQRQCGHIAVANSLALRAAGITAATPDPPGGAIDRDEHGEPTGVLRETALALLDAAVPAPTDDELAAALRRGAAEALRLGLVALHSYDAELVGSPERTAALLTAICGPDGVPVRVSELIPAAWLAAAHAAGIRSGLPIDAAGWNRWGPLKIFADGSLGGRTAALQAPYADDPTTAGIYIQERAELFALVAEAHRLGYQLGIHAIGDGALHRVLDAIAAAQVAAPRAGARHRLIHCQITDPASWQRLAALGVVADIQPVFLRSDGHWFAQRVGAERAATSYAWASLLRAGVAACGGSDCPVEPLNPLYGIYCAVTRQDLDGTPAGGWNPDERLTVAQALDLFTGGAAYADHREAERGGLAPGMAADVTVLDGDPFTCEPAALRELRCLRTIVAGRTAYEA